MVYFPEISYISIHEAVNGSPLSYSLGRVFQNGTKDLYAICVIILRPIINVRRYYPQTGKYCFFRIIKNLVISNRAI